MSKREIGLAIVVLVVALTTVVVLANMGHRESKERLVSATMMACSGSARLEIEKALIAGVNPPSSFSNDCPREVTEISLGNQNQLILKNSEYSIELKFTPRIAKDEITWTCAGSPEKYIPAPCRKNT